MLILFVDRGKPRDASIIRQEVHLRKIIEAYVYVPSCRLLFEEEGLRVKRY